MILRPNEAERQLVREPKQIGQHATCHEVSPARMVESRSAGNRCPETVIPTLIKLAPPLPHAREKTSWA